MKDCAKGHPITFVEHGSPAERKGVYAGDVLIAINDTPVVDLIDETEQAVVPAGLHPTHQRRFKT